MAFQRQQADSRSRAFQERALGILALLTIAGAFLLGMARAQADVLPSLQEAAPTADRFEPVTNGLFAAYQAGELIGYVSVQTAIGYGGPLQMAVLVDLQGEVGGYAVIGHKETRSFFNRVREAGFFDTLLGKGYQAGFVLGEDVDGISGATYTSLAIARNMRQAAREVASGPLGLEVSPDVPPRVRFGAPEITLIALFATGYFAHRRNFKYTRQLRWASMIAGMLLLGFWLNRPLTLANVNQFLLGFWPQWQTNLYWYLILFGILFVFTVDNKNPYCEWFCPFGAAQECLGAIGGAKPRSPGRFKTLLMWVPRVLAWLAIVLALYFRNPGLSSYEVFGTLFDLNGSSLQFLLLGIVLIASLFIRRPWCTYLCPLRPVTDLYRTFRKWSLETWQRRIRKSAL